MTSERAAELQAAYEQQRRQWVAEWWELAPQYLPSRDEEAEIAEAAIFPDDAHAAGGH
jgi:hypothetical protein